MRICRKILLVALAVALWSGAALAADKVWQVENFLRDAKVGDPSAEVAGVVDTVYPAEKRFGLLDVRRVSCCGEKTANCDVTALPVSWTGALPAAKAQVIVKGKVAEEAGKLVFVAEAVETMEGRR
jgi:hypothetical protein